MTIIYNNSEQQAISDIQAPDFNKPEEKIRSPSYTNLAQCLPCGI